MGNDRRMAGVILASDYDGTLSQGGISDAVRAAICRFRAAGGRFGVVSGRDHDKFKERSLTSLPGSQVAAPLVAECPLGLECRVTQAIALGSHTLFLAEILAVQVSEELLDRSGRMQLEKAGLLAYAHGHYYELGRCLGHFGYSVRRKPGPTVRR